MIGFSAVNMDYEAVIGLETHVQLKTCSKMWCACANTYGAPPNTQVCPVCLGLPGTLPVPNEEALRLTALAGLLLNCTLPPRAKFDRKSYFYPDMPKNYQITQYDQPSTVGGYVDFEYDGPTRLRGPNGLPLVRLIRAHLEEDVGKSFHFAQHSGVDFNRAGVPLLEIVSEPDIGSPDMAYAYLNALKEILIRGGISDCDMEKGMVRCDVNVSMRTIGENTLGAKIEIKNLNSFSGVRRALEYEIARQITILRQGGQLVQSTRRWDEVSGVTEEMRTKEEAHDYRYFPDPDLLPIEPDEAWLETVRGRVVELPLARKQRFMRVYGLPAGDAEVFKTDLALGDYFECLAQRAASPKAVANWVLNNLLGRLAEMPVEPAPAGEAAEQPTRSTSMGTAAKLARLKFPPQALLELVQLVESGVVSSSGAQRVFNGMFDTGEAPRAIVERLGLAQVSDTTRLEALCDQVLATHPGPAADYRAGKTAALNFLKGQVMKLSRGRANPALAGEILERKLKS